MTSLACCRALATAALMVIGLAGCVADPGPYPATYAVPPAYPPPPIYAPQPGYAPPTAEAPPSPVVQTAYGATCYAGVYTCALPQALPVGAQCSCPGLGAPSYGNVH